MADSALSLMSGPSGDYAKKLGLILAQKGLDTSPVASPWQGAARMAQALIGGLTVGKDNEDRAAANGMMADAYARLLGGGGQPATPTAASAAPSMPVPTSATVPNDSNAIPGTAGMNLALADRSQDFMQDNPGTYLSSGVRTPQQQVALYNNRANNPNPVAPPGSSNHERGMAVDIGGMSPDQRAMLPQYGLTQPVANDPPHVELAKALQPQQVASADPNFVPGGPAQPMPSAPTATPQAGVPQISREQMVKLLNNPYTAQFAQGIIQKSMMPVNGININGHLVDARNGREIANFDRDKPTNDQLNYREAVKGGYTGSFNDYQLGLKRASATAITNDMKGENAFSSTAGKEQATRFNDLAADAPAAKQMISDVQTLTELGQAIGTGKGAQIKAVLGPYADALGVKVDGLSDIQAFDAIVNRVAPTLRVKGSGAQSDFELKNFLKSLPALGNTEEGNAIASQVMQGLYQNKLRAAEIGANALSGKIPRDEAERQLRDLPDPMEGYRNFKKKTGAAKTQDVPDGQTATNPQTGERLIFRSGKWVPFT